MNSKLQPALIAGGALGAVGVLLGLMQALTYTPGEPPSAGLGAGIGCLSCLATLGAGMLAVYLYVQKSTTPAQTGDGAVLGLITGAIAGLINLIIGTPLSYLINSEGVNAQLEPVRQAGFDVSPLVLLMGFGIIGVIFSALIALIGGLIGVPVFEKRKGDAGMPPPPPPPGFSGGFGGSQPPPQSGGGFGAPPPPPPPAGGPAGGFGQ